MRNRNHRPQSPWSASGFEAHRRRKQRRERTKMGAYAGLVFVLTLAAGLWVTSPQAGEAEASSQTGSVSEHEHEAAVPASRADGAGANDRRSGRVIAASAEQPALSANEFICDVASVHDGDTFRCADGTRVRLSAIDTPEMPGACRPGRECAPGDPYAARDVLVKMIEGRSLRCEATGASYNRIAAWCSADGLDLSCAMLDSGHAVKLDRYWQNHRC